jgi:RNA polymerase sigma factor (sigma-70 family)
MSVDKLVADNVGLIYAQLNRFSLLNDQDAESLGYEALYNAAKTFDAERPVAFSTYATVCIYNAMCGYRRNAHKKRQLEYVSLYDLAYKEQASGNAPEIIDTIPFKQSIEDALIREYDNSIIPKAIINAYNKLGNDTYRRVIFEWSLTDFTSKQRELADNTGVSQSSVSMAINVFRKYLREELKQYDVSI